MALDLTAFNYALQEMYSDILEEVSMWDKPVLAMIPKRTDWTGDTFQQPIQYANNAGRAGTLAAAQASANGAKGVQFSLTSAQDYGVIQISGETIRASGGGDMTRGKARAFLEARRSEIKSTTEALMQSISHGAFRNGSGIRGTRASISSNTITLTNAHDGIFWDVGMMMGAYASDLTTARVGTSRVTNVNRGPTTTTVTVASAAAIASFADGDVLFVEGDYNTRIKGFASWVPTTAPDTTAFFGIDRSVDVTRLGGLRYAGTEPIVERLVNAEAFARVQGAKLDIIAMHPTQLANIKSTLGDKIRYHERKSADAKFSFKGVALDTDYGTVDLIPDPACPSTTAYGLQLNTWSLVSRGDCPGPLDHLGGNRGDFFTLTTSDGIEGRYGYYAQLACSAPGYNVTISLA